MLHRGTDSRAFPPPITRVALLFCFLPCVCVVPCLYCFRFLSLLVFLCCCFGFEGRPSRVFSSVQPFVRPYRLFRVNPVWKRGERGRNAHHGLVSQQLVPPPPPIGGVHPSTHTVAPWRPPFLPVVFAAWIRQMPATLRVAVVERGRPPPLPPPTCAGMSLPVGRRGRGSLYPSKRGRCPPLARSAFWVFFFGARASASAAASPPSVWTGGGGVRATGGTRPASTQALTRQ